MTELDAITEPGRYACDKQAYEADPIKGGSLRASLAWKLVAPGSTPAHAYAEWPRVNPDYKPPAPKRHFMIGTAAHEFLLGKGAGYKVIRAPDYKTKSARDARDAVIRLGQTPLLEHEEAQVMEMTRAARRQLRDLVDYGTLDAMPFETKETEQLLVWREDNGLMCRCSMDGYSLEGEILGEYKTTGESADPELFQWSARRFGYFFKLAFYCRGLQRLKIAFSPSVVIFVQETKPPYLLSMIRVDDDLIEREQERIKKAIDIAAKCLRSGRWPGYSQEGYTLGLTEREKMQMEQSQGYNNGGHVSSEDLASQI